MTPYSFRIIYPSGSGVFCTSSSNQGLFVFMSNGIVWVVSLWRALFFVGCCCLPSCCHLFSCQTSSNLLSKSSRSVVLVVSGLCVVDDGARWSRFWSIAYSSCRSIPTVGTASIDSQRPTMVSKSSKRQQHPGCISRLSCLGSDYVVTTSSQWETCTRIVYHHWHYFPFFSRFRSFWSRPFLFFVFLFTSLAWFFIYFLFFYSFSWARHSTTGWIDPANLFHQLDEGWSTSGVSQSRWWRPEYFSLFRLHRRCSSLFCWFSFDQQRRRRHSSDPSASLVVLLPSGNGRTN